MTAQLPVITSFYGGLLGLLALVLAGLVIRMRLRNKVSVGDGDNPEMLRTIRVQANFSEYVPLALLLMALGETLGGARWLVHAEGLALLIGRLMHAWGLYNHAGPNIGRFLGTNLTFITIAVAAIVLISRALAGGAF